METKICKKCGGTEYTKSGHCKACQRIRSRAWYDANKEKAISQAKDWKKRNPDKVKAGAKIYRDATKEEMKILQREWHKANPEKARERAKRHYDKYPERCIKRSRDYYLANPDKCKAQRDNYRAKPEYIAMNASYSAKRRVGVSTGVLSKDLFEKLFKLQRGKCACCHISLNKVQVHLDHIIPLAKGGSNIDNNIQLLCKRCNLKKHAKDPIDFMQENGFLC